MSFDSRIGLSYLVSRGVERRAMSFKFFNDLHRHLDCEINDISNTTRLTPLTSNKVFAAICHYEISQGF